MLVSDSNNDKIPDKVSTYCDKVKSCQGILALNGEVFVTGDGPDGNALYRVGKTDTLSDIAQKHLGRASRWIQVYRMNQDRITDPNRLKIGTTLRLPGDASNIQVVRGPGRYR